MKTMSDFNVSDIYEVKLTQLGADVVNFYLKKVIETAIKAEKDHIMNEYYYENCYPCEEMCSDSCSLKSKWGGSDSCIPCDNHCPETCELQHKWGEVEDKKLVEAMDKCKKDSPAIFHTYKESDTFRDNLFVLLDIFGKKLIDSENSFMNLDLYVQPDNDFEIATFKFIGFGEF